MLYLYHYMLYAASDSLLLRFCDTTNIDKDTEYCSRFFFKNVSRSRNINRSQKFRPTSRSFDQHTNQRLKAARPVALGTAPYKHTVFS